MENEDQPRGKSRGRANRAEQAIVALLQHGTVERAAAAVKVSASTLWRWLQDDEFQEAYRKARREAMSRTLARLQHGTGPAVTILLKIMADPAAPSNSRIRAALAVLNTAYRGTEMEDFEARIDRLERQIEEKD